MMPSERTLVIVSPGFAFFDHPQEISELIDVVQARRGYFTPKHAVDPAVQARQDIDEALFSRDEPKGFPLVSDNHISQGAGRTMELTVMAQIGLKDFHFFKSDGVNKDQLTFVAGLFDQNGNYLSGTETNVDMHYQDATLQAHRTDGLEIKSSFEDVKPGTYLVRLVARDAQGQKISATNGAIEVP